jgi:hypothetical protein
MVRNEEANLPACLGSLANQVDAIYLTDTGSTDASVEIARSADAHVRFCEWTNDFAAARNASIEDVKEDWILIFDADDRLPPGEAQKIRLQLETGFCAATVNYRVDAAYTPMKSVRLIRNGLGARFEGLIHENLCRWLAKRNTEGWHLHDVRAEVIHTGYSPEVFPVKLARNLPLLQAEWQRDEYRDVPEQRHLLAAELGLALAHSGQLEKARGFLAELLAAEHLAGVELPSSLMRVFVNLLWVHDQLGQTEERLELARVFEVFLSESPAYRLHRAMAELAASEFHAARHWFERFKSSNAVDGIPLPVDYFGAGLWRDLGICHCGEGDFVAAAHCFQRALEFAPENREYQLRLKACSR